MKRILLLTLALLAGCTRTTEHPMPAPAPQADTISDWAKLQLAIALTESRFDPNAVGSNGDLGLFQMREIYVKEVNRVCGTNYKHEDALEPDKAIEIFNAMQAYYNPSRDTEKALYYHNKSTAYKRKVLENLALIERYEALREQLIKFRPDGED